MPTVFSASITAGIWPKAAKIARTSSTEVEARKLTEPIRLPEMMASIGLSRSVALATQRRRCIDMITDSDGVCRSTNGTP
jgi:hypothetical protein